MVESKLIYSQLLKKLKNFSEREANNIALKYLFLKFDIKNSDLLINNNIFWNDKIQTEFQNDLEKLMNKTPVQMVTNSEFFYDNKFYVDRNTLIPRPETEELISIVIKSEIKSANTQILDVGTGSGCIAITLAKHLSSNVIGIDSSKKAIEIAKKNNSLVANKVNFIHKKIEDYNPSLSFDIIISNPPYIPRSDIHIIDDNVLLHEPHEALFVEKDPVYFYKIILDFAKKHLKKNGVIYFEINQNYLDDIKLLLDQYNYTVTKDFYDNYRFVKIIQVHKKV